MQSGGGTSGAPSTGFNYLPPGQPEVAAQLGQIAGPLLNLSANAGAGTPAGQNYPVAMDFVSQFLTGHGQNDVYNNLYNNAIAAGQGAASYAPGLTGTAGAGIPFASQALQQGFDPAYGQAISGVQSNPYFQQALDAAQGGAQLGAQGGNYVQNQAGAIGNTVNPLIQSGFDPQSALFNRSRNQLMDQTNAVNAMSGLAGTPYGASVSANALGNFDINWQNQQLARQQAATEAARGAANTSGLLYGAAPGLVASSGALPSNIYTGNQAQILSALNARNQGAQQGAQNFGSLLGSSSAGLGAGATLGAAPYNTGAGIASNVLTGLTNATSLGNNQYALPNQQIGNLMQYMGLGQNAAQLSGQLQNQAFNQNAQGVGGLLSGANTLFGGNGLLSGAGGLGLGGLGGGLLPGFGGAGGLGLGTAAELAAFEGPWAGLGAVELLPAAATGAASI